MVRFSCFHAHIHSHKQKKTVHLSAEAMQKTVEDTSQNQSSTSLSYSAMKNPSYLKEDADILINTADRATDSSPTEHDCRSGEIENKSNTDYDITVQKASQIKKSRSLGSGLDWKGRVSGGDDSEDETEQRFSCDGSADRSGLVVPEDIKDCRINLLDQYQDPMPSDSVQVNSDLGKNESMFSIGDPQQSEKGGPDNDDNQLSGAGESGPHTPQTPPAIVKSSSLPNMGSPNRCVRSFCARTRSAEDLNVLDSRKKSILMHEVGTQVTQNQERDDCVSNNDNITGENPADESYSYNYVGSAKDWIIPVSDGFNTEKNIKREFSSCQGEELPSKDYKTKRIEEWVMDLRYCSPLDETNEFALSDDHVVNDGNAVSDGPASAKLNGKANPGMEAAKRYISSMNATATTAQLTNLGLVVIPFLSAFVSLKALNLSGNAIVRITAGALPRGLHILNLSKNNISTIEGLRDLSRLRVLDLSYNRILRIGHGLASCSSLKELYLAGNKISEVEGLHRLLKLNVLDLRYNKISTTKCLGQLAANYNSLQAISLEGNPAQKNVGDEQLKKYLQSLLPHLTYYNRKSMKIGMLKDTVDRSARLGINAHQIDRGFRAELKATRKGTHVVASHKVSSSSIHGRKSQAVASPKQSRSRHGRLPPIGTKTTIQRHELNDFSKLLSSKTNFSIRRSRSEGTLGAL
ncbi:Outer arm dynein light chain 1 protein [Abeliophyllum distichum]|uniref:Outer arm dynein light chain 1 protein n=1 Tax=Abeliophyllum distichum TaxID=126358 RepID=A0ABD1UIK6_9LAMI